MITPADGEEETGMTQFVEVKAPVTGEKGKVPARSLRRWLDKGFEAVNAEEADQILAEYPDPNAPAPEVTSEVNPIEGHARNGEPHDADRNGVMDIFEKSDAEQTQGDATGGDPDVQRGVDAGAGAPEIDEPGTAADSADTSTSTSGRRRGGAATPDAR